MFTVADLRNIAIQIERNGEETYRKAAASAVDPEISKIFTKMADDEKRHAEWFESIQTDKELNEEQREMEAVGKTILQEMVKGNTFLLEKKSLDSIDSMDDLLIKSQGFEQDTILFYEMLSGFIDDEQTMAQLKSIISEETRHFEALKEMQGRIVTQA